MSNIITGHYGAKITEGEMLVQVKWQRTRELHKVYIGGQFTTSHNILEKTLMKLISIC